MSLKQLRRYRGYTKGKLTRLDTFLKSLDDDVINPGKEELILRLEKLEEIYKEFKHINSAIFEMADEDEDLTADNDEDMEFEENYLYIKVQLKQLASKFETQEPPRVNVSNDSNNDVLTRLLEQQATLFERLNIGNAQNRESEVQLPQIKLPEFDGKIEQWKNFSDMFKSLIHDNKELSNVKKFQYLSTSIRGSAAQVIEAIQVSDENYMIAWNLLQERYDDQRSIKKKHIQCLFEIPKIQKESPDSLRELIDYAKKHTRILKSMGLPVESWDALLVYMIETKLDNVTRRAWEHNCESQSSDQTFDGIIEFLEKRCKMLKRLFTGNQEKVLSKSENLSNQGKPQGNRPSNRFSDNRTTVALAQKAKCYLCQGDHYLYNCEKFLSLPVEDRATEIKRLRVCINCFRDNHFVKDCKFGSCRQCNKRHNTLLCLSSKNRENSMKQEIKESQNKDLTVESPRESTSSNLTVHHLQSEAKKSKYNLMSTAIVYAKHVNGSFHPIRVLLDSASEANFVSYAACNKLGIVKRDIVDNPIAGINNSSSHVNQACNIVIASQHTNFKSNVYYLAIPKVTNDLPSIQIDISDWHIPETTKLADEHFNKRSQIDMIISAEYFLDLFETGKLKLGEDLSVLHNTCLGWIVSGAIQRSNSILSAACHLQTNVFFTSFEQKDEFKDELKRFLNIEDCDFPKKEPLSILEQKCEDYFDETTTRDLTGRFEVRMPLELDRSVLGESKSIAIKSLLNLENRFQKNENFKERYCGFMYEYLFLGHMRRVESCDVVPKKIVYLSHHGVLRESSSTTKLRVVFNGSLKTSSGLSLNDIQLIGPTLQENLIDILLRFRCFKIAITADVIKMYRQVLIHKDDRALQRILFRFSKDEPIQEFELNTVTYGQACSPYLAIKCLRRLATLEEKNYPEAAAAVLQGSYVDDFQTGADSEDEAIELIRQMIILMELEGFELHKFSSNSKQVIESVPIEKRE